jgi:hypothetical protein
MEIVKGWDWYKNSTDSIVWKKVAGLQKTPGNAFTSAQHNLQPRFAKIFIIGLFSCYFHTAQLFAAAQLSVPIAPR